MNLAALDTAPDYVEPVEAWRAWRVVERDGELSLASVVKRTIWPAGEPLTAECLATRRVLDWALRRPAHSAPAGRCECGIYATQLERSSEYLDGTLPAALARVIGRVALWGEVVECERGFRASYAYPLKLYVPADASGDRRLPPQEIASRLERYGVPIEVLPSPRRDAPDLLRSA